MEAMQPEYTKVIGTAMDLSALDLRKVTCDLDNQSANQHLYSHLDTSVLDF